MTQAGEQAFQVNISDADIQLLHSKLELHRFPDQLEDAGWEYGAPLSDIKRLAARWKEGYDWRKFEAKLNQLPMFTRDISVEGHGTLNIHYIHQKSTVAGAIPLLFVHGCKSHLLHLFRSSKCELTFHIDRAWQYRRIPQNNPPFDDITI